MRFPHFPKLFLLIQDKFQLRISSANGPTPVQPQVEELRHLQGHD
jgi:hypothetical protein